MRPPNEKIRLLIGNPPYQDQTVGDQRTYQKPLYNEFMDEVYKVCGKCELIHPARFLFNAGSTPKAWNKKMLGDIHFKVLHYESDSRTFFPNQEIKGGIAITYYDGKKDFGIIGTFTAHDELNTIIIKTHRKKDFVSFAEIVVSRTAYRFTEKLHKDHPEAASQLSNGHLYDISTNIFGNRSRKIGNLLLHDV